MEATQFPSSSSLEYQFVVSSEKAVEMTLKLNFSFCFEQTCFLRLSAYLCYCYHPEPLLSVARCPASASVSGVKRWLSALLVVKTAAVTLHPSAAGGSV